MKKTEITLIIIGLFGIVIDLLHLPGASILIMVPLVILSFLYTYLGLALFNNIKIKEIFRRTSYQNVNLNRILVGIGTGMALGSSVMGIIFKFLSWPGSAAMLGIGFLSTLVIGIISLIKRKNDKQRFYKNILKRVGLYGMLCFILLVLPMEVWLNIRHPRNPDYVQAVMKARANPEDPTLWLEVDKERVKMRVENEK